MRELISSTDPSCYSKIKSQVSTPLGSDCYSRTYIHREKKELSKPVTSSSKEVTTGIYTTREPLQIKNSQNTSFHNYTKEYSDQRLFQDKSYQKYNRNSGYTALQN